MELLPGQWKMEDQDVIEKWEFNGDVLEGAVFEIIGVDPVVDTVETESLRIVELKGTLHYEATVNNQNDGEPVLFKLIKYQDNKWIFENLAHDFPQQIEYHFIANDSIEASIKGEIVGGIKTIEFTYSRID